MKYVYCLLSEEPAGEPALRGLAGTPVTAVAEAGICALVGDLPAGEAVPSIDRVRSHHEVVEGALDLCSTVLPCRFGTFFPDGESLRRVLRREAGRLRAALFHVRDRCEVGVRMLVDSAPAARAPADAGGGGGGGGEGSGRDFLTRARGRQARREVLREAADACQRELERRTAPLWTSVVAHDRLVRSGLLRSLAFLLPREDLAAFERRYAASAREHPGLKMLLSGPWPPYSFAEVDLSWRPAAAGGAPARQAR